MNMKNKPLQIEKIFRLAVLFMLLNVVGMSLVYAYDFSAICETGQTLYYNITDS